MYTDNITIYFNVEDFDPTCIEADITNELEKVNIWLKLIVFKYTKSKVNGFLSKAK